MVEPDPDTDAEREAAADADVAAGRCVPHERVREWLKTVGTPEQTPTPYSWRE
ncbi:antitoxin [Caulobacter flavus]|uniref:Antitoxin n=1 Tax=Caulobacter flavus TaxID=1679497 RepID=A0A2N5CVJ7_9CAUL|nr:antitoxin [Caulobacter flavus]AYV46921.1 antitoxin [Caulobacter flavus]PLR17832.1 antitoxin [Caulobacter flavus]